MRRRTDRRPGDYLRCARCRRLVLRAQAVPIDGFSYGPDCAQLVWMDIRDQESGQDGKVR